MLNLSLNELKLIARIRHIKGCKSMSKERLLSTLNEKNLHNARIKQIKKEFNKEIYLISQLMTIALDILFAPYNTEKTRLAYKSKYNTKCENQVILFMITDSKKQHYLAVKKLSALFKKITFYCLNYFH